MSPTFPDHDRTSPTSIRHVTCPECGNEKAVVAATRFSEMMCFCPMCEHVWDCPADEN